MSTLAQLKERLAELTSNRDALLTALKGQPEAMVTAAVSGYDSEIESLEKEIAGLFGDELKDQLLNYAKGLQEKYADALPSTGSLKVTLSFESNGVSASNPRTYTGTTSSKNAGKAGTEVAVTLSDGSMVKEKSFADMARRLNVYKESANNRLTVDKAVKDGLEIEHNGKKVKVLDVVELDPKEDNDSANDANDNASE